MRKKRKRHFRLTPAQRRVMERELTMYLEALSHDPQYSVRRACFLIEMMALPEPLSRRGQLEQLDMRLALRREKQGWGVPWTFRQLQRTFYSSSGNFRRRAPRPVTREEVEKWVAVGWRSPRER